MADEFHDKNIIASELLPEQLDAFIRDLAALPPKKRTLAEIARRAAELGMEISIMSAKSFRDTTFKRHLARLRRRQEKSQHIAGLVGDGSGRTLNDANRTMLAEKIFDELNADDDATGDDEEPARLDLEKLDLMTKAVQRLGKGFVDAERLEAALKESEAKLRAFEAKEVERKGEMKKLRDAFVAQGAVGASHAETIARLGRTMFGEDWDS